MEADSSPGTQEGLKHGWPDLCAPSGHPDGFPKWPWLAHKNGGTVKFGLGLISLAVPPHWYVAVEFFLIPVSQMGMPARVWAQMLGKPVHTDTQGEGRRADWHRKAPGSEEHFPLHQAPWSLGCQTARRGHKEPAGTSTPWLCCYCHHVVQSSPKTKLMPFCHSLPMSDHKPCNLQCTRAQFAFVHLPALSLRSQFPLHCIYPLLI